VKIQELDKKGFTFRKTGFVFQKKRGELPSQKKRFYITKKIGIANSKIHKKGFTREKMLMIKTEKKGCLPTHVKSHSILNDRSPHDFTNSE
jgi:hypothetical protein